MRTVGTEGRWIEAATQVRRDKEGVKHHIYSVMGVSSVCCSRVLRWCAAVVCCSGVLQWCAVACAVACAMTHESTTYTHTYRCVFPPSSSFSAAQAHRNFDLIYLTDSWVLGGSPGSGTGSVVNKNGRYLETLRRLLDDLEEEAMTEERRKRKMKEMTETRGEKKAGRRVVGSRAGGRVGEVSAPSVRPPVPSIVEIGSGDFELMHALW